MCLCCTLVEVSVNTKCVICYILQAGGYTYISLFSFVKTQHEQKQQPNIQTVHPRHGQTRPPNIQNAQLTMYTSMYSEKNVFIFPQPNSKCELPGLNLTAKRTGKVYVLPVWHANIGSIYSSWQSHQSWHANVGNHTI